MHHYAAYTGTLLEGLEKVSCRKHMEKRDTRANTITHLGLDAVWAMVKIMSRLRSGAANWVTAFKTNVKMD